VAIDELLVQDAMFTGDRVPLHVSVRAIGFADASAELLVKLDDQIVASRSVTLQPGSTLHHLDFVPAGRGGPLTLSVEVRPRSDQREATLANNIAQQTVRIIDEKIKVLYLEGKPRWEYRYLRAVLLRDRRIEPRFVMIEGDQDLAQASTYFLPRFPGSA